MNNDTKTRSAIAPSVSARLDATARRLEREYFAERYNKAEREAKLDKEIRRACRLLEGETPFALSALDKVLAPIYSIISAIECGGNPCGYDDASLDAIFVNEDGSCEKEEATHVCFTAEKCGDANNFELVCCVSKLFGISAEALENDSLDYNRASVNVPVTLFR